MSYRYAVGHPLGFTLGWLGLLLLGLGTVCAQNDTTTLQLVVLDALGGDPLVGATAQAPRLGWLGFVQSGGQLTLPPGLQQSDTLQLQYLGYPDQRLPVSQLPDTLYWAPAMDQQQETVVLTAERNSTGLRNSPDAIELRASDIQRTPSMLGEPDIMRVLQAQAGVAPPAEGSSGLVVRGGGVDQNLYLLDGLMLYNPLHLDGLFSTFPARAMDQVVLAKGHWPCTYGGRLSSVVNVTTRSLLDHDSWRFSGGVGLLSVQALVEGPLPTQQENGQSAGIRLNARRTHYDWWVRMINRVSDSPEPIPTSGFTDLLAQAAWRPHPKHQLSFTLFSNFDFLTHASPEELRSTTYDFGNRAGQARWRWMPRETFWLVTQASFSYYQANRRVLEDNEENFRVTESHTTRLRTAFTWTATPRLTLQGGALVEQHKAHNVEQEEQYIPNLKRENPGYNGLLWNTTGFVRTEYQPHSRVELHLGLRASLFHGVGASSGALLPEFLLQYRPHPSLQLSLGAQRTAQALFQLINSTEVNELTPWVTLAPGQTPMLSDNFSLSLQWTHQRLPVQVGGAAFVRKLHNLRVAAPGNDLFGEPQAVKESLLGQGLNRGGEVWTRLQHKQWRFQGSYTLSWADRQFDSLSQGQWFPYLYDLRHIANLQLSWSPLDRLTFSAAWTYRSGMRVTVMQAVVLHQGSLPNKPNGVPGDLELVEYTPNLNNYRVPAYHRLDLSATWRFRHKKLLESTLTLGVFNTYARQNVFAIRVDERGNRLQLEGISMLPILPSAYYAFRF